MVALSLLSWLLRAMSEWILFQPPRREFDELMRQNCVKDTVVSRLLLLKLGKWMRLGQCSKTRGIEIASFYWAAPTSRAINEHNNFVNDYRMLSTVCEIKKSHSKSVVNIESEYSFSLFLLNLLSAVQIFPRLEARARHWFFRSTNNSYYYLFTALIIDKLCLQNNYIWFWQKMGKNKIIKSQIIFLSQNVFYKN